jgi:hypothetical protein
MPRLIGDRVLAILAIPWNIVIGTLVLASEEVPMLWK